MASYSGVELPFLQTGRLAKSDNQGRSSYNYNLLVQYSVYCNVKRKKKYLPNFVDAILNVNVKVL